MYDIISIGSASQDIYLKSEDFEKIDDKEILEKYAGGLPSESKTEIGKAIFKIGGGGTNTACTFSNLGFKTAFLGIIGKDKAGIEVKKSLHDHNISTNLIKTDLNCKTAFSIILLTPGKKRIIMVFRGPEKELKLKDIDLKKLQSKWFYITSLAGNYQTLNQLLNYAKENKIKIALNPGSKELENKEKLNKLLDKIDILLLNFQEANNFTGEKEIEKIFDKIFKFFKGIAVITLGAKGAVASDEYQNCQIKTSSKKNIKDATGAGDAFGSAFVSGIILKNQIPYALELGIANSRAVLDEIGAKNGLLKKIPEKFEYKAKIKK